MIQSNLKESILGEILETIKFALFASGNGSNALQILKRINDIGHKLECLIVDNPNAKIIEKWNHQSIPLYVIPFEKKYSTYQENKALHENKIIKKMEEHGVSWAVLAGYMRILSEPLLKYFKDDTGVFKILNIHPSLLPSFPGKNAIEDSFQYGVQVHGITIHLVDEGVDSGPIIFQKSFERNELSFEEYKNMTHSFEHLYYWKVIKNVFDGYQEKVFEKGEKWKNL